MKIINVIQRFDVGGIQKLLLEYLRYFKGNNEIDYRVVVLEKTMNSMYEKMCLDEGLKLIHLNCEFSKSSHYYIRKISDWYNYNFRLYKYLKKEKPDIVHTHNTRILIRITTCIKLLRKKYKWFHTLHSDPYAVNGAHIPFAKRIFNDYKIPAICLNETQFLKAKERYGLQKCLYLYNAFDPDTFKSGLKNNDQIKKELNIPKDSFLISAIGRIDPVKNYGFFIDVINEIVKRKKNTIALIVGEDSGSDELKQKVKLLGLESNIRFLGVRNDVCNILNIADRFVSTSLTEASSMVTLEAQSFDKYCIVSNAIAKESICLEKRVVKLYLSEDIALWADQIIEPTKFEKSFSTLNDYYIENTAKKMINIYIKNSLSN